MIVHIIPDQKFTVSFIDFIRRNYQKEEHRFYIYNDGNGHEFVSEYDDNIIFIHEFEEISLPDLVAEKIFIHGFYTYKMVKYLVFHYKKIDYSKVVLIIWGADIYNRFALARNPIATMRKLENELLKRFLISKVHLFMTFAAPDFELLCRWYKGKGKQFDCLYPSNANKNQLDQLRIQKNNDAITRILLGNSATPTNQHISMLNILTKYKDEKIEIISPLSYGNMTYAKEVEDYGNKLFGDKFVAIYDYLEPDEYTSLLGSMDIAIFNNNRQQATGNIEILSYLGKKVFIRSDTSMWGHYVNRDGCAMFDACKINELDFNEFISIGKCATETNREYFSKIWDEKYIKSLWDKVIEYEKD